MNTTDTLRAELVSRDTHQPVQEFDLAGFSERQIDRFWDGLVMKVDFERFYVVPELAELRQSARLAAAEA